MADLNDLTSILERLREAIDPRSPIFARRSTGMEISQAVQYYHSSSHLTDSNDQAPDNSAVLVAFKPAIVRAYVRPAFFLTTDTPVGGTLLVERKQGIFGQWTEVTTLSPWLASTTTPIDDTYADERGNIWNSLNFRIPANLFAGNMRLTLKLDTGEIRTTTITAYLIQTLRVRVISVSYSGPSTANPAPGTVPPTLNLAAPTLGDAQSTAALAFRMMPVQQTGSFASAGMLSWSLPLDDARSSAGGCSANWNALLTALNNIRVNDGNRADVVYYGLLPAGIPLGVPGCGRDGLGSAAVGNTTTFVHEIGHGYGFQHTPSGPVGRPDPNYPVYEPYMSASIGEYGVDIQSGTTVFSPATSTDYMSYGSNRWMSLYQHNRLIEHTRLAPVYIRESNPFGDIPILVDPRPWWLPEPPWEGRNIEKYALSPVISVRGAIDERGKVKVESVARINASSLLSGPEISWNVLLMNKSGDIASRARLTRIFTAGDCGCTCSCHTNQTDPNVLPLEFHAMLPNTELGGALQILDSDGKEVWIREAPDTPVRFAGFKAQLSDATTIGLFWSFETGVAQDVWAQYSIDRAQTWRGLLTGLGGRSAQVDTAGIPAGRGLVRLLAHDGFSTAVSNHVEIEVPERVPYPAIMYPADGEVVAANVDIEILGSAVDQGGFPVDDDTLEWIVDGIVLERRGRAIALRVKEGDHKLALRALASQTAEVTISFFAKGIAF